MYYVYVLFSEKDGHLYVGYTSDLRARMKKHESGFVTATRYRRPLKLIHYEAFTNTNDAKRREKFLKGGKGRGEMRVMLEETFRCIKYAFR